MAQDDSSKQDEVRRNRPEAIGRGISAGRGVFLRAGFRHPDLVLRWREIVGPEIARLAQPLKLSDGGNGGILTLKAEPAAATFLQHQTRSLCERINAYLGRPAVSRLRFVPGTVPSPPVTGIRDRSLSPPPEKDPVHGFSGPPGLKAALIGLARSRRPVAPD